MDIAGLTDFKPPVSGEALAEMARCYQKSLLLEQTFKLGIFENLAAGRSVTQLAEQTGARPERLALVLDALVSVGLLEKNGDTYTNTVMTNTFLCLHSKFYQGDLLRLQLAPERRRQWERIGDKFQVTLIASTLYEEGRAIAEAVQADLKKVGIAVEVRVLESAARFEALKQRNYDLVELGGICATNDPTPWFSYYFGTQHPEYCVLKDQTLQELVGGLYAAVTAEARREIFFKLQELLKERAPGIFLYSQDAITVTREAVKDFTMEGGMPGSYSYLRVISLSN
ncbi:ABC transporter substrate-binding protein [Desulfofundulus salinus]|uniref:ABC transporter substrate-binding protein n=1 Tax=Desulfofundulus salinus TaxID=2419843 RepID=A0A494WWF9_9FIRM|nr:ABC transporter substrate-binding protein [Desulfofundulus salinum]RKO66592.1 hypothetical protein D7024_06280 [Desulfofundulus salinum]